MFMVKKPPLLTVFKITIGNYTFRVYDYVPKNSESRFFIDDNLKYKTRCINKSSWKRKLFFYFERETINFSILNDKMDEAINLFFKNNKDNK